MEHLIYPIAYIYNDYTEKFGIPRQSGLAPAVQSRIVFEPEYRNADALRGLEGFSHLWLIWQFSEVGEAAWSPTVRPPRLGGNTRMGVFATRSPFRPNRMGLSCVKLDAVADEAEGPVLYVSGADLMNGTPIFDIKPYLPYADSIPDASGGFAEKHAGDRLDVDFPEMLLRQIPDEKQAGLLELLAQDPRPAYQEDAERIYGLSFGGYNVKFIVEGGVLKVREVEK